MREIQINFKKIKKNNNLSIAPWQDISFQIFGEGEKIGRQDNRIIVNKYQEKIWIMQNDQLPMKGLLLVIKMSSS